MKNVLLIGIRGVYNYGCEAIVRGTVNIFKKIDNSIKIYYASYNYEDDIRRLSGCDVEILPRQNKRWTLRNIMKKCLSYFGIYHVVSYDKMDWLQKFDTIFSIGGDIYTLSYNGKYHPELANFLCKCQHKGMKYILWGASVGKFEKNPDALNFFKKHLPQIDLIVAREKITVEYLEHLNVKKNVCIAPDPAFFVECPTIDKNKQENSRLTIGINLSPLSALYEYKNLSVAVQRQSEAIINLIEQMPCDVMLLPHVLDPNPKGNDLIYMQAIYDNIKISHCSNVLIIDNDPGFVGLKSHIGQCDYVIAARMHCAINAITMSIPTLFLAYSEKAKGMAEFVYDSKGAVISLADFENIPLIIEKLKNWNWVSKYKEIRKFDFAKILK